MDIVIKSVDDLVPYFQNPRVISNQAIEQVAKSFQEHGIQQPICIDKDNVVVAGHTRLLAAKKLGYTEVPCTVYDDTPEKTNAYRLADNKVAEFSTWENEFLDDELKKLRDQGIGVAGFDMPEMKQEYESFSDLIEDDAQIDEVGYNARELSNQLPLMFYLEQEHRDEIMQVLEKIRDEKYLETKSNALLYLARNYK